MVREKQQTSELNTQGCNLKNQKTCCKNNCKNKFTEQKIQQIKQNYRSFDYQARVAFIVASVDSSDPQRKKYFLLGKSVCVLFYTSILEISKNVIRLALDKFKKEDTSDRRGKHGNYYLLSENKREAVISHIRSFPTYCSHYKLLANLLV
ncbi:hypothetical protein ACKWTF_009748 [Chironomus riparius]